MVPIISLLLILGTSLVVTRWAAVALEHTGLSRDAARFQARSAFTGVGFTTSEAENIVDHPVRRRIVSWLMLVGNVGVVSAMAALLLSAIDLRTQQGFGVLLALLVGGLATLWALGSSSWVDRRMCSAIRWAIERFTTLEVGDFVRLLHLRDDYGVSRFSVEEGHWLAGQSLRAAGLGQEGLLVLGIECPDGNFMGTPPAAVEVRVGDELVLYGRATDVAALRDRSAGSAGDREHEEAVAERPERANGEQQRAGR